MTAHAAAASVSIAQATLPAQSIWARLRMIGVAVGVVGALSCAILARGHAQEFYAAWLVAFIYFLTIALGCLYFVLIHTSFQGGWGIVVRRVAENGAATLPLFALLFLPVALGMNELFPWTLPAAASDPLIQTKAAYLNTSFFYVRAAVYFLVWSGLAWWFARASYAQDASHDPLLSAQLRRYSAAALIPLAITHHFASVDWLMSLDPHWFSTIFGVYSFAGSLVAAFAFMTVVVLGLHHAGVRGIFTPEHFQDLGKLLLAFTVFWAYIGFSQYFLIWYGNIPEETIWFKHRLEGGWRPLSMALAIGHFGIPFPYLLMRGLKRKPATLLLGAVWMLAMHLLDIYWVVAPNFNEHGPHFGLLDVAAFVTVGALFMAAFGWLLQSHPVVPVGDPRLGESLAFENF